MLFPTIQFAVFFVVVLTANWLLMPYRRRWKLFMLAASYVFYGAWDWRFAGLLALSTLINQVAAHALPRTTRPKPVLMAALTANLAILGWFKYYGFFASSLINLLRPAGINPSLPLLQIALPVGISFFTFHAVSYVVDIYRGEQQPAHLLDFALYLAFFPHLVAGPIVRASELIPQFRERRDPRKVDAARGFALITGGLFKKVVVANTLATMIVDPVFAGPDGFSALEVLFAIYGYAIQIYADFSGYTDIAIGVALLLGFWFPDNFNAPYRALSLQDFWRRWHMTLSRWLRDYLYIPLGGSRGSSAAIYRNLMITMLLGGLWHGAAWNFVVWGGIHGGGLAVERWWAPHRRSTAEGTRWGRVGRRLLVFHVVCLGWVFFRSESLAAAGTVLSRLLDWGPAPIVTPLVVALIAGSLAVQYVPAGWRINLQAGFSRLRPVAMAAALGLFLLLLDGLGPAGVAPFIYFQF